mmetsp:Transcript_8935/g.18561  ORF Transcript_8935/g.18561 Transcript_8935/m.18561 type:complete len:222 (+) Transcript_8935:291-956(+)
MNNVIAYLGLGSSILSLVYGLGKGGLRLVGKLVFVVELGHLGDGLLYKISDNSKSGHSGSNKIVFVIDLIDLGCGGSKSALDLFDGSRVNFFLGLKFVQSPLKRALCGGKNFVLAIQGGQVVVNFDGRLGDGSNDFSGIVFSLGDVVRGGSTDCAKNRSSDDESSSSSDKTGSEFNGLLLDGNELTSSFGFFGHMKGNSWSGNLLLWSKRRCCVQAGQSHG